MFMTDEKYKNFIIFIEKCEDMGGLSIDDVIAIERAYDYVSNINQNDSFNPRKGAFEAELLTAIDRFHPSATRKAKKKVSLFFNNLKRR